MQYTIQIPKPCHESWEAMTPADAGRHCASCCKTVVDFTNWEQEDILHYLQQHAGTRTCGRFRSEQLHVALNEEQFITSVTYSPLPYYKKLAAIFLFAFGLLQMSCNTHPAGVPVIRHNTVADTTKREQHTLGEPLLPPPPPPDSLKLPKQAQSIDVSHEVMGDMEIVGIVAPPPPDTISVPEFTKGEIKTATDTTKKKDSL